jgi:hypothetical protein
LVYIKFDIYDFITITGSIPHVYWWTISPRDITLSVVSSSALTWFIRYIYVWNLVCF